MVLAFWKGLEEGVQWVLAHDEDEQGSQKPRGTDELLVVKIGQSWKVPKGTGKCKSGKNGISSTYDLYTLCNFVAEQS